MTTVLVTGGTGYIGSWVVRLLVERGYRVRVSVRNIRNSSRYTHLMHMDLPVTGKLDFFEADLLTPGSFDQAMIGCEMVFHIASPFRLSIKDPQRELVDPALLGTQNVLTSACRSPTISKVVLTSSVVAIYGDTQDGVTLGVDAFTERHWNTTSSLSHQPYSYSKTVAEKAAWKIYEGQRQWKLVVMNPSWVVGPMLSPYSESESISLVRDFLRYKFALGMPRTEFAFVDVRDVAQAHVKAAELDTAEGRFIISNQSIELIKLGRLIGMARGSQLGMPFIRVPKWIFAATAPFYGFTRQQVKRNVGYPLKFDSTKSREKLGMTYRPIEDSIRDMIAVWKS